MKKLTYLFITLLTVSAIHCKKPQKNNGTIVHNDGIISAVLNGQVWKADDILAQKLDERENIAYIQGYILNNGSIRQKINIAEIDLNAKKQQIYPSMIWTSHNQTTGDRRGYDTCIATYSSSNYDVVENIYDILENEDNYIEIEEYNASKGTLKGSFQISLCRQQTDQYPPTQGLPDTLRFTNGKFDVVFKK